MLARAPHGQTLGYKYDPISKKFVPILTDTENIDTSYYEEYEKGLKDFTLLYLKYRKINQIEIEDIRVVNSYMDLMLYNIDTKTAEILGSIKYDIVGKKEPKEFAPRITYTQSIKYLLGTRELETKDLKLSYLRSKRRVQKIIDFKHKYGNIWKWLFFLKINKKQKIAFIRICGVKLSFRSIIFKK